MSRTALASITSLLLLMVVVVVVVVTGCGDSNRAAVRGEVTLDDEPIDGGTISFVPRDSAAGPAAWGKIEQGRYTITAREGPAVGSCRVEIRWTRKTGRKLPAAAPAPLGSMVDETAEVVPDCYNTASELEENIQPGENGFDFKLMSQ